jgi:hypothetical protein
MIIDPHGMHAKLPAKDLDAVLLVQVIAWIEESHYWHTVDKGHRRVECRWCGARKEDWSEPVAKIDTDKLQLCPQNPVIKGAMGDPTVPYTLTRIKA